jgi:mRNA interferase MazF
MPRPYIPERGHAVWLHFDPQTGHEQAGRRPAIVLTPSDYNRRAGLAIVCPITSRVKGYPFEATLPDGLPIQGVVLCDQARSLDWTARRAEFICVLPKDILEEIVAKLETLIVGED